jgi:membrane protein implicated in regulation of membrane protease activity
VIRQVPANPPRNFLEWSDRHLTRATDDDRMLDRYLRILTSMLLIGLFVLVGMLLLFGGVMAAIHFAGVPPWGAVGVGGGGTAIVAYFIRRAVRRGLRDRDGAHGPSV